MDNGQLWSRFAAVHKRAVTVLLSLNGTRFNAARGLAPAFMRGGARTADSIPIFMSFRTSPQTGVGIPAVQQTAFQFSCHSEPVLFPGVGISLVIVTAFS